MLSPADWEAQMKDPNPQGACRWGKTVHRHGVQHVRRLLLFSRKKINHFIASSLKEILTSRKEEEEAEREKDGESGIPVL